MTLPVRVCTWNPVYFRVWDILQIGVNGLPCEDPAINSIFWGHNDMSTLPKAEGTQNFLINSQHSHFFKLKICFAISQAV